MAFTSSSELRSSLIDPRDRWHTPPGDIVSAFWNMPLGYYDNHTWNNFGQRKVFHECVNAMKLAWNMLFGISKDKVDTTAILDRVWELSSVWSDLASANGDAVRIEVVQGQRQAFDELTVQSLCDAGMLTLVGQTAKKEPKPEVQNEELPPGVRAVNVGGCMVFVDVGTDDAKKSAEAPTNKGQSSCFAELSKKLQCCPVGNIRTQDQILPFSTVTASGRFFLYSIPRDVSEPWAEILRRMKRSILDQLELTQTRGRTSSRCRTPVYPGAITLHLAYMISHTLDLACVDYEQYLELFTHALHAEYCAAPLGEAGSLRFAALNDGVAHPLIMVPWCHSDVKTYSLSDAIDKLMSGLPIEVAKGIQQIMDADPGRRNATYQDQSYNWHVLLLVMMQAAHLILRDQCFQDNGRIHLDGLLRCLAIVAQPAGVGSWLAPCGSGYHSDPCAQLGMPPYYSGYRRPTVQTLSTSIDEYQRTHPDNPIVGVYTKDGSKIPFTN